jgi:hypothetical protein
MNCKYLKLRSKKYNKYWYCSKYKKEVSAYCKECKEIEYKEYKPIKLRSNKLNKREKQRFSIIYQDMTKCAVCGSKPVEINEVFEGAYRQASIKYGMCMPMCHNCHQRFHNDREFALYYKIMFQNKFVENNSLEEFLEIFKIDYRNKK